MVEASSGDIAPETTLNRLRELRRVLLHLHKALLETEQATYEQVHVRVSMEICCNRHQPDSSPAARISI